jgi:hypothetical protein
MKGFGIYVKNDLLEPKHYHSIGQSLWLYLWLLDKMTSVSEDGVGKVLGGSPVRFERVTSDLPMSDRTYTRYVERLVEAGYITALRTPYGYVFTITKAKKFFGLKEPRATRGTKERTVNVAGRTVNVAGENRKCGGNKEDNTVDNTSNSIFTEPSGSANTMNWKNNRYSDDYEEGVVDLETGELHDPVAEAKNAKSELYQKFRVAIDWLIKHQGRDPKRTSIPKQLKAIQKLYTMGVSASEARQVILECEGSPQWQGRLEKPDYWTVVAIIQKRG